MDNDGVFSYEIDADECDTISPESASEILVEMENLKSMMIDADECNTISPESESEILVEIENLKSMIQALSELMIKKNNKKKKKKIKKKILVDFKNLYQYL